MVATRSVKNLALGLIACVMILIAAALEATSPSSVQAILVPNNIDLGLITQGEVKTFQFSIQNSSSHDVTDIVVVASCGCTIVDLPRKRLRSHESTIARGNLDSAKARGNVKVNLLVKYMWGGNEHHCPCTVTAVVDPVIELSHTALVFEAQSDGKQTVKLSQNHGVAFEIRKVVISHPAFSVAESQQGTTRCLDVSFDSQAFGEADKFIPVSLSVFTDVDSEPVLRIPISVHGG